MLAIDGFCGKRYNAESDGARKSTVPIILTVGSQAKAFSSGSVNGGVWSQLLTHIQRERILMYANCKHQNPLPNLKPYIKLLLFLLLQ